MALRVKQRQIWDSDINTSLHDELLFLHQNVDHIRQTVTNFSSLPLSGNRDGDLRLAKDEKAIYQWVQNEFKWVRITEMDDDFKLGAGYFREIHNGTDGQIIINVGHTFPYDKNKLMVFKNGELINVDGDYHFIDYKTIELAVPLTTEDVIVLYLPASTTEINIQTETVYEYDANQNIVKSTITGDVNRITKYEYNSNQNIIKEIVTEMATGETKTREYAYDSNHNVINVKDDGVDILHVHKISEESMDFFRDVANHTVNATYDNDGRLTTEVYGGDITRRIEYFYNRHNRLGTRIIHEEHTMITENYRYNSEGRVIQKEMSVIRNGN